MGALCACALMIESGMIDMMRDKAAIRSSRPRDPSSGERPRPARRGAHAVTVVVYEGVALFELGVACDIFGQKDVTGPDTPWYRLSVCGSGRTPVTVDGGFRLQVPHGLEKIRQADTVVVPPTDDLEAVPVA